MSSASRTRGPRTGTGCPLGLTGAGLARRLGAPRTATPGEGAVAAQPEHGLLSGRAQPAERHWCGANARCVDLHLTERTLSGTMCLGARNAVSTVEVTVVELIWQRNEMPFTMMHVIGYYHRID